MTFSTATSNVDLKSKPLSPYTLTDRARGEARIHLAKSADLLRMEGRLCQAEKLYRQATRYADTPGAVEHLMRLADHCRQIYEARKAGKKF
jgi:hypothetical protein